MEIRLRGQTFRLLPQKAIFWVEEKMLLIGDLHLGKVTHFRKAGIAIPSVAYGNNFTRLDEMILSNHVEKILLLGDLFHNRHNIEWTVFSAWRKKYPQIEIQIALGNHDILPRDLFEETNIIVNTEIQIGAFLFSHHPLEKAEQGLYRFCGHVHPVFCLKSKARQSIKLPCFVFDEYQAILPSFGVFTGGFEMKAMTLRHIYVVAENKILKI